MAGDDVAYSIIVSNRGDIDAFNVLVRDSLHPRAWLALSAADTNGWISSGSVLTNNVATLPAGQTFTLGLVTTVSPDFAGGAAEQRCAGERRGRRH